MFAMRLLKAGKFPWLVASMATLVAAFGVGLLANRLSYTAPWQKKKDEDTESDRRDAKKKDHNADGESCIDKTKAILLILSKVGSEGVEDLARDFCGTVITSLSNLPTLPSLKGKTVYLCGDISRARSLGLEAAEQVFVVRELAHGLIDSMASWPVVGIGRVPVLVHGVGVYYRRFFSPGEDNFKRVCTEHTFQSLTESTKPGTAHRTGIYLTPVEKVGEDLHFRLLRCSTNLSGPTLNFGINDKRIVDSLNQEAVCVFQNQAPLNHILAQIYHNTSATEAHKQTKAKIKAHSDKTKDMPQNGIMAFCTFYDQLDKLQPMATDAFDYGHKGISGLTKLHFRLKAAVAERPGCTLTPQFSVTLYPDSVFFMPLSTNRLYTHEIRPAGLDAMLLPTRLGYVVRCSAAEAVFKDGHTFLKTDGELVKLEPPTNDGMAELRNRYSEENLTDSIVDYGKVVFSMNRGDYTRPTLREVTGEFRQLAVPVEENLFQELLASVMWEDVGKGRQGTVLVNPDEARGIPIVRTTTKYSSPAHCFQSVHKHLAQRIQESALIPVAFNNALIENYTDAYATMGFHSDQAQDLEEGSSIAVFSCYRNPDVATPPRKLVIESKEPGVNTVEIPLTHNSVIVFSLEANRRFRHKIVMDRIAGAPENQWLGVTFRTSTTFVQFREGQACFEDGTPLTMADEDQRRDFFKLRSCENKEIGFTYPRLTYTISKSDCMLPSSADAEA
eukprot:TRINITY_DN102236_c0_g1_i1.p1 TRINITY_DN102236_c0_g1~~TRINITY_DN102236_c0_g1_i1.p1  ORF type:complete len:728 (-),score=116.47 TRINITY_DN102236_c0_g1_i1:192-2375(-)